VVTTQRDGRVIRYLLTAHPVSAFLVQHQAVCESHTS
jgi:hypothetical protein